MDLAQIDPVGWMRDILYCSLKIYQPEVLGEMTLYDVGDELENLSSKQMQDFLKELFEDFVKASGLKKKVTPVKKE